MNLTIEVSNGVVTVAPCDEHEPCDKDIRDLPDGFTDLAWHRMKKGPCDWGDDVLVALSPDSKTGYSTFDGWCTEHLLERSKRKWTDLESFARLQVQVSEGDVEVEETGDV